METPDDYAIKELLDDLGLSLDDLGLGPEDLGLDPDDSDGDDW